MGARTVMAAAMTACVLLAVPVEAQRRDRGWESGLSRVAYDRGYREGLREGEQDAERGRRFNYQSAEIYRDGDRGYNREYGSRQEYRDDFRRGFASGYQVGYERVRSVSRRGDGNGRARNRQGIYQEPAVARGFSDGYEQGLDDGDDGDRYDPVRHGDYREADEGYYSSYGSKDAYKNNYRAGYRQGYEEGYRDGARRR